MKTMMASSRPKLDRLEPTTISDTRELPTGGGDHYNDRGGRNWPCMAVEVAIGGWEKLSQEVPRKR